jgi:hypothetical protein
MASVSLTSALRRTEWLDSRSGRFIRGNSLDATEKRIKSYPCWLSNRAVQTVVRRFTDWAIAAPSLDSFETMLRYTSTELLDNRLTSGGGIVSLTRRPPFTPWNILVLISVRGWVKFRATVRLEGLCKLCKHSGLRHRASINYATTCFTSVLYITWHHKI